MIAQASLNVTVTPWHA